MGSFPTAMVTDSSSNSSTCLSCRAKLLLYPGTIHPKAITEMLGVEPSEEIVAGTNWTTSLGKVKTTKFSGWFLISDHEISSLDLSDHVDWLLNRIRHALAALERLRCTDGVIVRMEFVWWGRLGCGGPTIRADQLLALSALDLECSLGVCYYSDDK